MKTFKTIIVEDNKGDQIGLLRELQKHPFGPIDNSNLTQVYTFNDAKELILSGHKYDLAILDKNLDHGKSCFDLIKIATNSFKIIALATTDREGQQYFENMKHFGGSYLTIKKPFTEDTVEEFIADLNKISIYNNDLQSLIHIGHTQEGKVIKVEQIIYAKIKGTDLSVFYHDEKADKIRVSTFTETLIEFSKKIDPEHFIPIGRNMLLHLSYVDTYTATNLCLKSIGDKSPPPKYNQIVLLTSSDYKLFKEKIGIK